MAVTLHLPTALAKLAGGPTVTATGTTVGEVVGAVAARFPEMASRLHDASGAPFAFVMFYLNDEDIRFCGGFDAPVTVGDELTVVPAIAGG